MKKTLFVLLALLLPVWAGAWTLPVPSGMTVGDIPYAVDSSTLGVSSTQLTDQVVFVGPASFKGTTGTWTLTRLAAGNVALVKTAGTDDSYINVDITEVMRSTASKGFRLTSIKYVHGIGVASSTAHTITLYSTTFANAAAPVVAAVQASGTISYTFGTVTSPYIHTESITVPAYLNPLVVAANPIKYSIEIRNTAGTSATYNVYGVFLLFTSNNVF